MDFNNDEFISKLNNKLYKKTKKNEAKVKVKYDYQDINNNCDYLQNYLYENKYYKRFFIYQIFLIPYFGILLANTNILMFLSIIRDPIISHIHQCYNSEIKSYYDCTYKNFCICHDESKCVISCYSENKDKVICTRKFNNKVDSFDSNENNMKDIPEVRLFLWFNKTTNVVDNHRSTIFVDSYQYCSIQNGFLILMVFFILGGLLGDIINSILADLYGKRKVILGLIIVLLSTSVAISIKSEIYSDPTSSFAFQSLIILISIYGFLFGYSCFSLVSLLYTYIIEIFPSSFSYFTLNTMITTYQSFSWLFAIIFTYFLSDFTHFYIISSVLCVCFFYLFWRYNLEIPRFYDEYANIIEKEKIFYSMARKILYKKKNTDETDDSLPSYEIEEKDINFKTLNQADLNAYYYKELVFFDSKTKKDIEDKEKADKKLETINQTKEKDKKKDKEKNIQLTKKKHVDKYEYKKSKLFMESNKITMKVKNKQINNNETLNFEEEAMLIEKEGIKNKSKQQIGTIQKQSLKNLFSRMWLDESVKDKVLLYIIIWLIFAYIYFGLQIRVFYDNLNPNPDYAFLSSNIGVIVYLFASQLIIQYVTDKIASFISIKRNIIFFIIISFICSMFPDIQNIWYDTDRIRYFGTEIEKKSIESDHILKVTAMVFSGSALTLINLLTISVPYTSYRNTFFGLCRSAAHFSNLISVLFMYINNTQMITTTFMGFLCFVVLVTANIFLDSEIKIKDMINFSYLRQKLEAKAKSKQRFVMNSITIKSMKSRFQKK